MAVYGLLSGKSLGPDHEDDDDEEHDEEHDDEADDEHAHSEPPPGWVGHLKLPFGPFLALGAMEYMFFGDTLIDAWFGLIASILPTL